MKVFLRFQWRFTSHPKEMEKLSAVSPIATVCPAELVKALNCDLWVSHKDVKEWPSSLEWDHSHFPLLAKREQHILSQEQ